MVEGRTGGGGTTGRLRGPLKATQGALRAAKRGPYGVKADGPPRGASGRQRGLFRRPNDPIRAAKGGLFRRPRGPIRAAKGAPSDGQGGISRRPKGPIRAAEGAPSDGPGGPNGLLRTPLQAAQGPHRMAQEAPLGPSPYENPVCAPALSCGSGGRGKRANAPAPPNRSKVSKMLYVSPFFLRKLGTFY